MFPYPTYCALFYVVFKVLITPFFNGLRKLQNMPFSIVSENSGFYGCRFIRFFPVAALFSC